jgi:hypothetical protein
MYLCVVKKLLPFALSVLLLTLPVVMQAQCAMCTKTASQLGEKPALGLNNAILYLMLMPFAVIGVIAWRWWKTREKE